MSLIGDLSDPKKDAAAIEPVLDELEAKLIVAITSLILPAIETSLKNVFEGLTITIAVSRKPPAV
jgi:hypothetical protein